jgi:hypothetical protein
MIQTNNEISGDVIFSQSMLTSTLPYLQLHHSLQFPYNHSDFCPNMVKYIKKALLNWKFLLVSFFFNLIILIQIDYLNNPKHSSGIQ